MSNAQPTAHGGGDSLVFAGVALAAYAAFGAFAFLHDGSATGLVAGAQDEPAHIAVAISGDTDPAAAAREAVRMAAGSDRDEISGASPNARVDVASVESLRTPPVDGDGGVNSGERAGEVRLTRSLGGGAARANERSPTILSGPGDITIAPDMPIGNLNLQFLVKFDGEEGVRWRDRFLDDPNAARAAFEEMGRRNSDFAGLRLVSMNYSGLATVEFVGDPPAAAAAREALSDDIVRRLGAATGVDYAEPNLVGWRESNQP